MLDMRAELTIINFGFSKYTFVTDNDLNKNVKIVFSLQRESKNEGSEASQKPSKIDEETSS